MDYLPYERMAQLITVSAVNKQNTAMSSFLSIIKVGERDIKIRFSDYVKSQIHLNVSFNLYGRSISEYARALYYLQGDSSCREDAEKVLRYFYSDMSKFLINNPEGIRMCIEIDSDLGEELEVNLQQIIDELKEILYCDDEERLPQLISNFRYSSIMDMIDDREDAQNKIHSYALASVLDALVQTRELKRIRMV